MTRRAAIIAAIMLVATGQGWAEQVPPPKRLPLLSTYFDYQEPRGDLQLTSAELGVVQPASVELAQSTTPAEDIRGLQYPGQPLATSDSDADTDSQSADGNGSERGTDGELPAPEDSPVDRERLTLADVVASVYRAYPEILQALQEREIATGQNIEAFGAFDTKIYGHSINEPTGFYENYRHALGLARRTWWGGYVSAGYRLGRDDFQPWYKERQTDEGGEFKVALRTPLCQGRAIDPQRVAVFRSELAIQLAEPAVQQAVLDTSRMAMNAYWEWVAAGAILEAQRELLELAETRGEQFEVGVKAGKFPAVDLILNQQLIAERTGKVLVTEQKYLASAFKLSLFIRDGTGAPMIPNDAWLPKRFPQVMQIPPSTFDEDLAGALARRPEPRTLQLQVQQVDLDRQLARNGLLPRLDLIAEASQDTGHEATKSDDKGEFELVIGIEGELPIQRRKPRGKIRSTTAKITQLRQKIRLQRDKISAEIRIASNAIDFTNRIVDQAELALRAAIDTLERYRYGFQRGKVDLIYLNLLESKANEDEIKLIEAQKNCFLALGNMQASLGLDPLEQALTVASLPDSERPAPRALPEPKALDPEELEKGWQAE